MCQRKPQSAPWSDESSADGYESLKTALWTRAASGTLQSIGYRPFLTAIGSETTRRELEEATLATLARKITKRTLTNGKQFERP